MNASAVTYDDASVEPTEASFNAAARFAVDGKFDEYVSVGGGSAIDTAKAANLYTTHPADFMTYVNAPIGDGRPVPGPLRPHIACPTTSGTGSECTGSRSLTWLPCGPKPGDPDATRTMTRRASR
jgi:hydroxyacid-oxoacid transhydrogenase